MNKTTRKRDTDPLNGFTFMTDNRSFFIHFLISMAPNSYFVG